MADPNSLALKLIISPTLLLDLHSEGRTVLSKELAFEQSAE